MNRARETERRDDLIVGLVGCACLGVMLIILIGALYLL